MASYKQAAVEILKEAKAALESKKEHYICYAINFSDCGYDTQYDPVKILLTRWIETSLGIQHGWHIIPIPIVHGLVHITLIYPVMCV